MNELKEFNYYNFIADLFFYPKNTESKDEKKSLTITSPLSILSLGIAPLAIGIQWGINKVATWIKRDFSAPDKQTQSVAQANLNPNRLALDAPDKGARDLQHVVHEAQSVAQANVESNDLPVDARHKKATDPKSTVPKKRYKLLGEGQNAKVYQDRDDPTVAIKIIDNRSEYDIGKMLNHRVLAKFHKLGINSDPNKPKEYYLFMEKVNGKILTSFQRSNEAISNEIAVNLIQQAKELCIYLFEKGVYWKDVNDGNIFIEDRTDNLRIIDFGCWQKETDSKERVKHLLLGAMELTTWIVGNSSCVKRNGRKDREKKKQIAFPKDFFKEQIQVNQILSLFSDFSPSWMTNIASQLEQMDENQMKRLISSYFNHVVDNLSKEESL